MLPSNIIGESNFLQLQRIEANTWLLSSITLNVIVLTIWVRKQSLTLAQNYQHLGLVARLKSRTGGTEKAAASQTGTPEGSSKATDCLSIVRKPAIITNLPLARIERDPVTGVARVVHTEDKADNPLNDPLNPITEKEYHEPLERSVDNHVIIELEEQAKLEAKQRPRQQSQREEEWLAKLVAAHGDDYNAMRRDMKLNRFQQTEGDIKRRIARWKAKQAALAE